MLRSLAIGIVMTVFRLLWCSTLIPRIVGGQKAQLGEFPMIVHFFNQQLNQDHCGGTIISSTFVLSAAHCFVDCGEMYQCAAMYAILVGDVNRFWTPNAPKSRQLIPIKNMINHEQYGTTSQHIHDINIAELYTPIVFSKDVAPAVLARTRPRINEKCRVAGWGREAENLPRSPQTLKTASLLIADERLCIDAYQLQYNWMTMLCVGQQAFDNVSCYGDSGGPLICNDNVLVGIVSYARSCAYYTSYTDVAAYRNWISEKLNKVRARSGSKRLSSTFTTFKLFLYAISLTFRDFNIQEGKLCQ